jgi:hypothetical protein
MERLIVEYSESDGFTYSCTNTLPIIYESKEKAISDFETLLLQHQINLEDKQKKIEKSEEELARIRKVIFKLNENPEKEKELKKANAEFMQAFKKDREISDSFPNEFKFGGQNFYYSNFFERNDEGKEYLSLPQIYTLDEFFSDVSK